MAKLRDQPRTQSSAFVLAPGARCYFYLTGTLTPAPVYAAPDIRADPLSPGAWLFNFETEHPNPLRSDSAARLPPVYLNPAITYRMRMLDAAGNLLHDLDPFGFFPGPAAITPVDDGGAIMPLARLTLYLSRTHEVVGTYTADAAGVFAEITLADATVYRVKLEKADGTLVYDVDPYPGNGVSIAGGGVAALLPILVSGRLTATTTGILTSSDGINWTIRSTPFNPNVQGMCWSPELGLVVCVGNNSVMTSPDGINWTQRTPAANKSWSDVCWSAALSLFVAVSDGNGTVGTSNAVMTSPDGITWTSRVSPSPDRVWRCVRWFQAAGLFVAGGTDSSFGARNGVMSSPDGINWTTRQSALDQTGAVGFLSYRMTVGPNYIAASSRSSFGIHITYDGINWTWRSDSVTAFGGTSNIVFGEGKLILTRNDPARTAKHVYSVNDGVAWTLVPVANCGDEGAAYSDTLSMFVTTGPASVALHKAMYSLDGLTWTQGNTPAGADSFGDWFNVVAANLPP